MAEGENVGGKAMKKPKERSGSLLSITPEKIKYVTYIIKKENSDEKVLIRFNADNIKNMTNKEIIDFLNNRDNLVKDLDASPHDRKIVSVGVSKNGNFEPLYKMDAVGKVSNLHIKEGDIEGVKFSSSGKVRKISKY